MTRQCNILYLLSLLTIAKSRSLPADCPRVTRACLTSSALDAIGVAVIVRGGVLTRGDDGMLNFEWCSSITKCVALATAPSKEVSVSEQPRWAAGHGPTDGSL